MDFSQFKNIKIKNQQVVKLSVGDTVIWNGGESPVVEYIQFSSSTSKSKPFVTLRWKVVKLNNLGDGMNVGISTIPNDPAASSSASAYKYRMFIGNSGNYVLALNGTVYYANPFSDGTNKWGLPKLSGMVIVDETERIVEYTYTKNMYFAGMLDGGSDSILQYLWMRNMDYVAPTITSTTYSISNMSYTTPVDAAVTSSTITYNGVTTNHYSDGTTSASTSAMSQSVTFDVNTDTTNTKTNTGTVTFNTSSSNWTIVQNAADESYLDYAVSAGDVTKYYFDGILPASAINDSNCSEVSIGKGITTIEDNAFVNVGDNFNSVFFGGTSFEWELATDGKTSYASSTVMAIAESNSCIVYCDYDEQFDFVTNTLIPTEPEEPGTEPEEEPEEPGTEPDTEPEEEPEEEPTDE